MKLDLLVFAAHPDDMELGCSGTVARHKALGYKVGCVDLTKGQLGTRGTVERRMEESKKSSVSLGLDYRNNLGLMDGFFEEDKESLLSIVQEIRRCKPEIVLANAVEDRHPDHPRASKLVSRACFLAGLKSLETSIDGVKQEASRPKAVYHYIQDRYIKPDFVIDITDFWTDKLNSIKAFNSQFFDPKSGEPSTPISGKVFLEFLEARAREMGRSAGYEMGEGFTVERISGVKDVFLLD